jgi:hypothetical protein
VELTPQTCADLRELMLADGERFERHAADCSACAAWLERQGVVAGMLGTIDRLVAPVELEGRLRGDFEVKSGALLGALRGIERLEAPEELEELLAQALSSEEEFDQDAELEIPAWATLLGNLELQTAPRVLDRLVDEELADLPAAVTRRFAGGLFRRSSPRSLTARIAHELGAGPARPQPAWRHWGLPLGSAVAAAALFLLAAPLLFKSPTEAPPRIRVIQVESLASLDPLARSLVAGFAGGRVQVMASRENRSEL